MPRRIVVAVDGDTPEAAALLRWTALNVTAVSTAIAAGTPTPAASSKENAASSAANTRRDDNMGTDDDPGVGRNADAGDDANAAKPAAGKAGAEEATPSDVPWARGSPTAEAPPSTAEGGNQIVVTILHAMMPPQLPVWGPDPLFTSDALLSEVLAENRRRSIATAAALRAHAARLHLPATVVTRPGDPRSVVSEYVEKTRTDLLVVGSRGLSGLGKLLLGSVSSFLVAHVGCPVVVYRPAKDDDA
ncbi:hypothetical protein MMPV_002117 [Pyropia vietnamensis]